YLYMSMAGRRYFPTLSHGRLKTLARDSAESATPSGWLLPRTRRHHSETGAERRSHRTSAARPSAVPARALHAQRATLKSFTCPASRLTSSSSACSVSSLSPLPGSFPVGRAAVSADMTHPLGSSHSSRRRSLPPVNPVGSTPDARR